MGGRVSQSCPGGGGVPSPVLVGLGYNYPGVLPPGTGVPCPLLLYPLPGIGILLSKGPGTSHWGTRQKGHGTSGSIMDGDGIPLPPSGCGQTHTCENSSFPILRMRLVIRSFLFGKYMAYTRGKNTVFGLTAIFMFCVILQRKGVTLVMKNGV